MNRMLVVVFGNDEAAFEGSRELVTLHDAGTLTLYALEVIAIDGERRIHVRRHAGPAPVVARAGTAVGGFVGLLGDPAGTATGVAPGNCADAVRHFWNAGVDLDFVEEAGLLLQPGRSAVIAEVEEDRIMPVEARMASMGGTVFRRGRTDVAEARFDKDIASFRAEIRVLEAEFEHASGEVKNALEGKIASARGALDSALARAMHRLNELKLEAGDRIAALEGQLASVHGVSKAFVTARLNRVRMRHAQRSATLEAAWKETRESQAA